LGVIRCNDAEHLEHPEHSEQRRIKKFNVFNEQSKFESHPHRQFRINQLWGQLQATAFPRRQHDVFHLEPRRLYVHVGDAARSQNQTAPRRSVPDSALSRSQRVHSGISQVDDLELNVAKDKIVTNLDEVQSDVWMMDLEPQH
jgi:hypothetical protein